MKTAVRRSSRKIYRWLRHPRHRKRSKFRNWLAERVFDRLMWTQPTAHAFAGGLAAGLAVGMILIPMQMFVAAVICCFLRFHIPVAVVAVWISNPATWYPCWVGEGWVGRRLFRISSIDVQEMTGLGEKSAAVVHVYTGAVFCALAVAAIGYPIGLWFGQRIVTRREERRERQLELARKRAAQGARLATAVGSASAEGE